MASLQAKFAGKHGPRPEKELLRALQQLHSSYCETLGMCTICQTEFCDMDQEIYELPCAHLFHKQCLQPWFNNEQTTCPNCKKAVAGLRRVECSSFQELAVQRSSAKSEPVLRPSAKAEPRGSPQFPEEQQQQNLKLVAERAARGEPSSRNPGVRANGNGSWRVSGRQKISVRGTFLHEDDAARAWDAAARDNGLTHGQRMKGTSNKVLLFNFPTCEFTPYAPSPLACRFFLFAHTRSLRSSSCPVAAAATCALCLRCQLRKKPRLLHLMP